MLKEETRTVGRSRSLSVCDTLLAGQVAVSLCLWWWPPSSPNIEHEYTIDPGFDAKTRSFSSLSWQAGYDQPRTD